MNDPDGGLSRLFLRGVMALEQIALELHDLVLIKTAERDEKYRKREAARYLKRERDG